MKIIYEYTGEGGLGMTIIDCSRPVAADRWYVKIVGRLSLPVLPEFFQAFPVEDADLARVIRKRLGGLLVHTLERERNFIAEATKDGVIGELSAQLLHTMAICRAASGFPARLFSLKYQEARLAAMAELAGAKGIEEDAGEPADFSHCFR